MSRGRARRTPGSTLVRAGALLAALLVGSCASDPILDAAALLAQPVELEAGQGAIVGTILLSAPTGVSDAADQQTVRALNAKLYEAVLAPVAPASGASARPSGERYRVRFFAGVEKKFAIRARAGTYTIEQVASVIRESFGDRSGACRIARAAELRVVPGQITYVGRLWMIAEYKPDRGSALAQSLRALGVPEAELAEAALDTRTSAIDRGDEIREKLRVGEGGRGRRIATELWAVDPSADWECAPSPAR